MLEDISVLTGGTAIFESLGKNSRTSAWATWAGQRKSSSTRTIRRLSKARARVRHQGPHRAVRREIENTKSDYDREKLEERLAKLAGGVAKINVGASTESEMKAKKARVEDALHATRAAVEEGILPGGGVALIRAAAAVKPEGLSQDEEVGYKIVLRAAAPLDANRRQRRPGRRHSLRKGVRNERPHGL